MATPELPIRENANEPAGVPSPVISRWKTPDESKTSTAPVPAKTLEMSTT